MRRTAKGSAHVLFFSQSLSCATMGQMEENGRYNMIHKFHPDKNRWDGVGPHIYKENPGVISRWRRTASLRLSIISTCMLS